MSTLEYDTMSQNTLETPSVHLLQYQTFTDINAGDHRLRLVRPYDDIPTMDAAARFVKHGAHMLGIDMAWSEAEVHGKMIHRTGATTFCSLGMVHHISYYGEELWSHETGLQL